MQTCQAAAGLTLRRLPFSPWANQTELWEGHPRLWCLCRRGNSAWQLLAFRQQPVFMEIILPLFSPQSAPADNSLNKNKAVLLAFPFFFGFFLFFLSFFFFYLECERSKISRTTYRAWQCTPAFEVIRSQGRYKRTASIRLPQIEETQLNVALWREPTCHFPFVLSFEGKNSLPASILKSRSVKDFWFRRDILHYITASTWRARWNVSSAYPDPL